MSVFNSRIFNFENIWAKTLSQNLSQIIFDDQAAGSAEGWEFRQAQDGNFWIRNIGSGFYVFAFGYDIVCSPDRDAVPTAWSVQQSGNDTVITVAGDDRVWTFLDDTVVLRPADGSYDQRFNFQSFD